MSANVVQHVLISRLCRSLVVWWLGLLLGISLGPGAALADGHAANALPAPTNLAVVVHASDITLTWKALNGAASYSIYRATTSGSEGQTPYKTGITSASFINTKVDPGIVYYYQIAGVDGSGTGTRSVEVHGNIAGATATATPAPALPQRASSGSPWGTIGVILLLLMLSVGALYLWRLYGQHGAALPWLTRWQRPAPPAAPSMPPEAGATLVHSTPRPSAPLFSATTSAPPPSPFAPGAALPNDRLTEPYSPSLGLRPPGWEEPPTVAQGPGAVAEDFQQRWNDAGGDETPYLADRGGAWAVPAPPPPPPGYHPPSQPLWPGAAARPRVPAAGQRDTAAIIASVLIAAAFLTIFVLVLLAVASPLHTVFFPNPTASLAGTAIVLAPSATPLPTDTAAPSVTPTLAPTATPNGVPGAIAINAGGDIVGNFVADVNFSGGAVSNTTQHIALRNVRNPAPETVYQTERYGNFTYTFTGLDPNASYLIRLHFAEIYFTHTGERQFNVSVQGQSFLQNFDIVAAAGGPLRAVIRETVAHPDASGTITIQFSAGNANMPKVSGIEVQATGD